MTRFTNMEAPIKMDATDTNIKDIRRTVFPTIFDTLSFHSQD